MKRGERGQLTTAKSQTTSTHCMIENSRCVLAGACRSDGCLLVLLRIELFHPCARFRVGSMSSRLRFRLDFLSLQSS
ncbi:hypothetical protein FRX31_012353 [Thalictrum thalictroides]|uniref:Uncharacterized protein n=1 Tax=Thalictrum thalictroides TaxID=46969 RepID=A0A7J6WKZ7_THATH|nr:hypothetical protein FRX31_012353 [Thalictrum thalictroides]